MSGNSADNLKERIFHPHRNWVQYVLRENGIIVHNRTSDAYSRHTLKALGIEECVRVSFCHYNTSDEVDVFPATLQRVAR